MNVLDARVGKVHLASEKNSDFHVNAFLVETITQRVIAKIEVGQRDENRRAGEQRANDVVLPKRRMWPLQRHDLLRYGSGVHSGSRTASNTSYARSVGIVTFF